MRIDPRHSRLMMITNAHTCTTVKTCQSMVPYNSIHGAPGHPTIISPQDPLVPSGLEIKRGNGKSPVNRRFNGNIRYSWEIFQPWLSCLIPKGYQRDPEDILTD